MAARTRGALEKKGGGVEEENNEEAEVVRFAPLKSTSTSMDTGQEGSEAPMTTTTTTTTSEGNNKKKIEYRKVTVPQHRFTPLKEKWLELYGPVTEQMRCDMRMNLKTRKVELRTTDKTEDSSALQKCADFVQAFVLGFDTQDAIALLRLDDLYVECFELSLIHI